VEQCQADPRSDSASERVVQRGPGRNDTLFAEGHSTAADKTLQRRQGADVRKSKIKFRIKHAIKHWRALFKRRRNRATFICITGSSAKSSTTVMLSHILSGVAPVYTQVFRNTLRPHVKMLGKIPPSHRYVVCETGADRHRSLQPMIELPTPAMSTQCSKARRLRLLEKRFHFLGWLKAYERSSPPSS
jgi:hypothetical protein